MQERKNKLRALLLIALLLTTTAAYYFTERDSRPTVDPSLFRVEGLDKVDSALLESGGRRIVLNFDGTRWMVNNKHRADAQMIEVFFATLAQVVPKRPVSENMRDSVAASLEKTGIRVSLFTDRELAKEFTVGGNSQKSETYFVSSTDGPFVMTIPGYRVYAAGVFELDESGWRDKQAFRFNQRNFRSLSTTFVRDSDQSFVITYEDQVFGISGINEPDTAKLFEYLDGVALLKAEELYSGGISWVDSLMALQPSFSVEVTDTQGRVRKLVVYPPVSNQQQVIGIMGEEAALFQKKDIVRIAKKRSYFQKSQ